MLPDIVSHLKAAGSESSSVAQSEVRRWMSSDDPEVFGATYALLSNEKIVRRITPSLPFDEIFSFLLRYYKFCLTNDPHGEWVDDRFTAGCDFVSAFVLLWDEGRDKKYFQEMKTLLSNLYINGPGEVRDSIDQVIVEHLFERTDIQEFFGDWRDDPQLRPAYNAGKVWADGGGKSPITQPRKRPS
jgi:hypothetical protein